MPSGVYKRTEEYRRKVSLFMMGNKPSEETRRKISVANTVDVTKRFRLKIDKKGDNDCWNWKSALNESGYGMFSFRGKPERCHRVAWILAYGEIPKGLFVLHKCDNPKCCNVNHLFLGTNKNNIEDMIKKDRQSRGETSGTNKLTEQDVICIRILKQAEIPTSVIMKMYNVCRETIRAISNRKIWKHI